MTKSNFIMIYGNGSVGKTFSTATLFKLLPEEPTQRVIFLTTEPNARIGLEEGLKYYIEKGEIEPIKEGQLYLAEVKAKGKAFGATLAAIQKFAKETHEQVYNPSKTTNNNKDKYTYFVQVISRLSSLKGVDYVTGEEVDFGNIAELEQADKLVIDGLSSIIHGMWNLLQGDRLVNDRNDYQIIQKQIVDFFMELRASIECTAIIFAHEEQGKDNIWHPALKSGQALHGSFSGLFANLIYAYKTNTGFFWAGKKMGVETAARNLPQKDTLTPDFSKYDFF